MNYLGDHTELLTDNTDPLSLLIQSEEKQEYINHYREASIRFIDIMNSALGFIMESNNKTLATISVAYALNLNQITQGKSQREMALTLGLSHATISWNVQKFKEYADLKI